MIPCPWIKPTAKGEASRRPSFRFLFDGLAPAGTPKPGPPRPPRALGGGVQQAGSEAKRLHDWSTNGRVG